MPIKKIEISFYPQFTLSRVEPSLYSFSYTLCVGDTSYATTRTYPAELLQGKRLLDIMLKDIHSDLKSKNIEVFPSKIELTTKCSKLGYF